MKPSKLQHRVTRAREKVSKLLELGRLQWPLWIRRVLVRAQEGQLEARPGVNPAVALSLFGHCACYCACNFVISPLNSDRRTARPRPYKFCDCSKRFVIRLLVAVDQRRDVLPPAAATSLTGSAFRSVAQRRRNACQRLPSGFVARENSNARSLWLVETLSPGGGATVPK